MHVKTHTIYLSMAIMILLIILSNTIIEDNIINQANSILEVPSINNTNLINTNNNLQAKAYPYCGDGTCDYNFGENAYNCPEDCYV